MVQKNTDIRENGEVGGDLRILELKFNALII